MLVRPCRAARPECATPSNGTAGVVFETVGDAVHVAFPKLSEALAAALALTAHGSGHGRRNQSGHVRRSIPARSPCNGQCRSPRIHDIVSTERKRSPESSGPGRTVRLSPSERPACYQHDGSGRENGDALQSAVAVDEQVLNATAAYGLGNQGPSRHDDGSGGPARRANSRWHRDQRSSPILIAQRSESVGPRPICSGPLSSRPLRARKTATATTIGRGCRTVA